MRVLRIDQAGDMPGPLELHAQVTVVQGLRGTTRARLVTGLASIPRGRAEGVSGEIEAQGVRFDLTPEALSMLDLPDGVDIVVHASDLPGSRSDAGRVAARRQQVEVDRDALLSRLADARIAAEQAERERSSATADLLAAREARSGTADAGAQRAAAVAAADQRLVEATAAAEQAAAALAAAQSAFDALADQTQVAGTSTDELEQRRAVLRDAGAAASAAVDEAQARLDPDAAEALAAAQAELAAATEALAALEAGAADGSADAADRPGSLFTGAEADEVDPRLLARREEVRRELVPLAEVDTTAVAAAVARISNATAPSDVELDDAHDLADQWSAITDRLHELGVDLDADDDDRDGSGIADRAAELAEARDRVADAKRVLGDLPATSSSSGPLSPEDVEAIEAAHAEVLEAQERSEARFGSGKKGKRRLTEARDAEQEVLDRHGFETYAEFMMSSGKVVSAADGAAGEEGRRRVDEAQIALTTLEADIAGADAADREGGDPDVDAEVAVLRMRLVSVRSRIEEVVGHEVVDDPTAELRGLDTATGDADDDLAELRQHLADAGMAVDDAAFRSDTLVALARVWLGEQHEADAKRAGLQHELAELDAQISGDQHHDDAGWDDQAEAEPASAEEAVDPARIAAEERLEAARSAAAEAEARAQAHADAEAALAGHEAAFFAAQDEEDAIGAEIAQRAAAEASDAAAQQQARDDAAAALAAAESEHQAAAEAAAAARDARDELGHDDADAEVVPDPVPGLEARLSEATDAIASAAAEVRMLEVEVSATDRRLAEMAVDLQDEAEQRPAASVTEELLEEIEWYLLTRLADHRQVSIAGSLPLVLDDPFGGLSGAETVRLMTGVERLASAVQVIVLSDDQVLGDWAEGLGDGRAAVVSVA